MRPDDLPLRESDFAAIRTAVMERIRHRPSRAPRLALAFGAMVILILAGLRVVPDIALPTSPPPQREVALAVPLPPIPSFSREPAPRRLPAPPRRRRSTETVTRIHMHIQTADPDIRIIWITQQEGP